MANYSGRRGPNVSQYLRELNAMPSDTPVEERFPVGDDELALFTNTQFFDFESGQTTDFQPPPGKPDSDTQSTRPEEPSSAASAIGEFSSLDFISGDFNFGDFGNSYASPTLGNFSENLGNLQPIQPNPQAVYPAVPNHQGSYGGPSGPHVGELKRKASETTLNPNRPMSMEEATRLAAEEDKRRRNTAASARFRVKKKQREQALEKNNKEMSDKVTSLEGRIQQLETENKWLKNLIMEKNGDKEDITSMWKDFSAKKELEANQGDEEKTDEKAARATDSETVKAEN